MRLIALAIVTAALIAGDIIEDMDLMRTTSTWAWFSSIALIWFVWEMALAAGRRER